MSSRIKISNPVVPPKLFGIDSKVHLRQWVDKSGNRHEFRGLLGIAIEVLDLNAFESDYNAILDDLFSVFGLPRERTVYKCSEILGLLKNADKNVQKILVHFFRSVAKLQSCKIHICYTYFNQKYLPRGIRIIREYGQPAQNISIPQFINLLQNYYNITVAWKLVSKFNLVGAQFDFDAMSEIYPTLAWEALTQRNYPKIVYSGDKISPVISTADIICRYFDHFLRDSYKPLSEYVFKDIIEYDKKVSSNGISVFYIGNPDLSFITPTRRAFRPQELSSFYRRPIIYLSSGNARGTGILTEALPIYQEVLKRAYMLQAAVKVFDARFDGHIIGRNPNQKDYIFPLNKDAEIIAQTIVGGGLNVEILNL